MSPASRLKQSVCSSLHARRRTVIDYDRILVLDAGRIVELDSPDKLLAKKDGVFKRMWDESQGGTKV